MGKIVPKTTLKISGRVLAFPFNLYLKIKISKIIGLNRKSFAHFKSCSIVERSAAYSGIISQEGVDKLELESSTNRF